MVSAATLQRTLRHGGVRGLAAVRRQLARRRRASSTGRLTADEQWLVDQVDVLLAPQPKAAVAVLVGAEPSPVADAVATGHPHAAVTTVSLTATDPSLHVRLAAFGPFHAIVVPPETDKEIVDLAALYRAVLFHLVSGGRLLVADVHPGRPAPEGLWPLLQRLVALREPDEVPSTNPDERALAAATKRVMVTGRRLAVTNGTAGLAKLREDEVDFVLRERGGRDGFALEQIEAETFEHRSVIRDHAAETQLREPKYMAVPRLSLRQYNSAYCVPRQITVSGNLLLPDTYRHHLEPRLRTSGTTELSPLFARVDLDLGRARDVCGSVFQWDSEWSGHFGHLITEQLSRLWAWHTAKARFPDLRPVLYKKRWSDEIAPWERGMLEAAGIDSNDAMVIAGPIRAERVIAATPMFSMPHYVSPRIAGIWDRVGQGAQAIAGLAATPSRIFVSRRRPGRWCHNHEDVERTFIDAGFTVVYPEDLPFAEQATFFRNAEVVAGFAGSAMFTLSLCDLPKRVLLVCSEGYIPHNEYMIAAVRGHELDIFWSVPDGWEINRNFTFDFAREGRHLRRVLAGLSEGETLSSAG
jgi:capsular polysaccharide biosynthesis protein